jgi:hypothetical protein
MCASVQLLVLGFVCAFFPPALALDSTIASYDSFWDVLATVTLHVGNAIAGALEHLGSGLREVLVSFSESIKASSVAWPLLFFLLLAVSTYVFLYLLLSAPAHFINGVARLIEAVARLLDLS